MRKKPKRYVIWHKPTDTYFHSISWRSIIGAIKPAIYIAKFSLDVNDARVFTKRAIEHYINIFLKNTIVDKNHSNIGYSKIDLEIKEIQVTYTVI
jgi:hypothetical protein